MKTHSVKSWPAFFEPISKGIRTHELRRNDRRYEIGDRLDLHEFDPSKSAYTGRVCTVEITSMTSAEQACAASPEALNPAFCILSIRLISAPTRGRP